MLVKTSSKVQKCKKKIKFFLNADFSGARGWGRGERRMTASGYRTSFWNDEKGLKSDSGDGGCEHTKTH